MFPPSDRCKPIVKALLAYPDAGKRALDQVSFSMEEGEYLVVCGESGCGKSTLGRTMLRLIEPTEGTVKINGIDMVNMKIVISIVINI